MNNYIPTNQIKQLASQNDMTTKTDSRRNRNFQATDPEQPKVNKQIFLKEYIKNSYNQQ